MGGSASPHAAARLENTVYIRAGCCAKDISDIPASQSQPASPHPADRKRETETEKDRERERESST